MNQEQEIEIIDTGKNLATISESNALDNLDTMTAFAEKLINAKSKLVPFKTVGDAIVVMQAAKDFGIPITAAFQNIYAINGRASVGVHFIAARLLNNGITYSIVEDYVPIYGYISSKEDGGIAVSQEDMDMYPHHYNVVGIKTPKEQYAKDKLNVVRLPKPIDRRTKIQFTRFVRQPNKTFKEMVIYGIYKWSDALAAGLPQDKPSTWGKYPRPMLYTKAFNNGAKKIGDDLLLGLNEITEMADVYNIPYSVDNEGNAKPIINDISVIKESNDADDADYVDVTAD